MDSREIEKFIIEKRSKNITLEHIKYLLEQEHDEIYDIESLTTLEESLTEKIRIQKEIDEMTSKEDVKSLILRLNSILNKLTALVNIADNDKITIMAIQQINSVITTLARLTGELKQQQEININKFYIKVTEVRNYLKLNLVDLADDLSLEDKKKLLKRLNYGGEVSQVTV